MISYFDTSVLLPTLTEKHELYTVASATLRKALQAGTVITTTLHTYAELYNNLTRPTKLQLHLPPKVVVDTLVDQLGKRVEMIELNREDYEAALKRCAQLGLISGVIYDALHYQAALKTEAEVIYTDNLRDFTRLQLPDENIRIEGIR